MPNSLEATADDTGGRYAIVVARFNRTITGRMLQGAIDTLREHGVADERLDVIWVPGAFELPTVAARLARAARHDAVICLGAVIRGETTHDRHINRAVGNSLAAIGAETGVPVIFGVLTCNTVEQAIARSGGEVPTADKDAGKDAGRKSPGNKGIDAALAALEMATLMKKLP